MKLCLPCLALLISFSYYLTSMSPQYYKTSSSSPAIKRESNDNLEKASSSFSPIFLSQEILLYLWLSIHTKKISPFKMIGLSWNEMTIFLSKKKLFFLSKMKNYCIVSLVTLKEKQKKCSGGLTYILRDSLVANQKTYQKRDLFT